MTLGDFRRLTAHLPDSIPIVYKDNLAAGGLDNYELDRDCLIEQDLHGTYIILEPYLNT